MGSMPADQIGARTDAEAGGVGVDQEHGHAFHLRFARRGARHDEVVVGGAGIGDKGGLGAVDQPAVAVPDRTGFHAVGRVGAEQVTAGYVGFALGTGHYDRGAACELVEPVSLLLLAATAQDHQRHAGVEGKIVGGDGNIATGQLFQQDGVVDAAHAPTTG